MKRNPGKCPEEARGKRVRVILANGKLGCDAGLAHGWAADGKNGCNWKRIGSPFDIDQYEVIG